MRFELKDLQKRLGIPILYVTHDQAETIAMSDRVAVMKEGKIMQIGSPSEIYENPANEFIADFRRAKIGVNPWHGNRHAGTGEVRASTG